MAQAICVYDSGAGHIAIRVTGGTKMIFFSCIEYFFFFGAINDTKLIASTYHDGGA